MAKEFKPLFGIKGNTWMKVDAFSTIMISAVVSRKALQGLGEYGVFGYGKSKNLKGINFGIKKQTWNYIDTISTLLWAFTLIHGAVDTYEEINKIPDDKQILPGKGIVYSGYEWAKLNVF